MNTHQAKWLARIIRLFGVMELFDAFSYASSWGLSTFGLSASDALGSSNTKSRFGVWLFLHLAVGIVLLRYARSFADWLCQPSRIVTHVLSRADNFWLCLAVRGFGVWLLIKAAGFFFHGVVLAASPSPLTGPQYTDAYYLSWFLIYFIAGFLLAKRPDIVGLVVTDASNKGNLPNKSPLPIPANVKPAADAPVVPPPGAAGR
jgi:hypothetical protein